MEYVENVAIRGSIQDKHFLLISGLTENYELKKILYFNDLDKIAIHSIFYLNDAIYMVDSINNKIYKYDFCSNESSEITVGRDPRHMCIGNGNIYVTNFESDNISVIDNHANMLTGSIPAGIKPHDIKIKNEDRLLYFSCYEENQITEYDIQSSRFRYFNTDGKPMHFFVTDLYIIAMTYFVDGNIYSKINFIDTLSGEIEDVIKIKGLATDIDYDDNNKMLYVINIEDKSIYIIDTIKRNILKRIYLGGYPESLTFGRENIYVTNSKKKQIAIIDIATLAVFKNINLEFTPDCIKAINTNLNHQSMFL